MRFNCIKDGRTYKQLITDSPTHIYCCERILYLTNSLRFVPTPKTVKSTTE